MKVDWRAGLGEVTFDPAVTAEQDIPEHPMFGGHYKASLSRGCCG